VPSGENYSYDSIGNFSSKGGVTYHYPSGGSQRPHAPDWVANSGNPYGYDANGNLTSADNGDRTYEYDVENHLAFVKAGGTAKHSMVYDGDGVLRKWTNDSNQTMLYVTPDYQLKLVSGVLSDVYVYYRFGGRGVAWHNNTDLCYVLSDHLSSSHAEVGGNQAEMGQRRYLPFGSDRAVPGASDIADEERFTSLNFGDTILISSDRWPGMPYLADYGTHCGVAPGYRYDVTRTGNRRSVHRTRRFLRRCAATSGRAACWSASTSPRPSRPR